MFCTGRERFLCGAAGALRCGDAAGRELGADALGADALGAD